MAKKRVKLIIVHCKHCGKEKEIYPSQQLYNEYFCDNKCRGEFRHKNRTCDDCGTTRNKENTYTRKCGTLDNLCKKCRMKRNEKARKKRCRDKKETQQVICGKDNPRGNQKTAWIKRMTDNPGMFFDTFHMPATPENIATEASRYF